MTTTLTSDFTPMRILLIAYEFPPSASPQSLRWAYLSRELHRQGHEVHVLTIDLGGSTPGLPALPAGVTVHRTYPGPVRGLVAMRRRYRERKQAPAAASVPSTTSPAAAAPSRGGWKHRVSAALQRVGEHLWFPDLRGEWHARARVRLDELLAQLQPDVVISSHEPATTLQLGLRAKKSEFRWIADLADPVLAPYTLPRWQDKARKLEADVCNLADHVLVTTPSARRLLIERHAGSTPITVLTQGFDDSKCLPIGHVDIDPDRLELLYTGSFYRFRTAEILLRAVLETPGVRLNVATIHAPDELLAASRRNPERVRLLGFLPHLDALAWQRRADVLVNLSNSDPSQVPGKCYEYMGAGRPILHLGDDADDAVANQVRAHDRGWVCPPESSAVASKLRQLVQRRSEGRLEEGLSLDREGVSEFGWSRLAGQLEQVLRDCCVRENR
ncbi:glycosyltransferase [Novilysobacter erysipheiresistens]|uniref:Glycosyltransferase n=1 Tax=Novilysobacter erysipheiresistens TaxID=1749332 RepID=A0ABU7Z1U9_9GAMM